MNNNEHNERVLSTQHIVWLIFGSTVGAGVVTLTGPAAGATGYSAWLAYGVATILGFMACWPFVVASSSAVLAGGPYALVSLFGHPVLGGFYIIVQLILICTQSTVALGAGAYLNMFLPSIPTKMLAIASVALIYIFVLNGVKGLAKTQSFMCYILTAGLLLFIVFGIIKADAPVMDVTGDQFFTNGREGFATAVTILAFSCTSWYVGTTFSTRAKQPKTTIPKAMFISLPLVFVLYVGTMIAALGTGLENFAGQTLAQPAQILFPQWVYYVFIFTGPLMAVFTTMNGNMSSFSLMFQPAAESGWLPKVFGKTDKRGVPYVSLTWVALCYAVPVLFDLSVSTIATMLSPIVNCVLLLPFCVWLIPKRFPDLWKNSTLHMPMWAFHLTMAISLAARLFLLYFALRSVKGNIFLIDIVISAAIAAFAWWRYRAGKVSVDLSWSPD